MPGGRKKLRLTFWMAAEQSRPYAAIQYRHPFMAFVAKEAATRMSHPISHETVSSQRDSFDKTSG